MSHWAELIGAIAALLWPLFAFSVLLVFRKEARRLLGRIKKGKLFGQEIELEASLVELQDSAIAASREVVPLQEASVAVTGAALGSEIADPEAKILEDSVRSPKAALLVLASEIEREARQAVGSIGIPAGSKTWTNFSESFAILKQQEALPPHVADSLKLFWRVRNRLVHGYSATDDDVLRAIDSGTTLLKALRAIPRWTKVVHYAGVPIFEDPQLRKRIPDATGVIPKMESPDGKTTQYHVFPTTRDHFRQGMRVAWEWNPKRVFGAAWYCDPDTEGIKQAWSEAAEFVGRSLDEL